MGNDHNKTKVNTTDHESEMENQTLLTREKVSKIGNTSLSEFLRKMINILDFLDLEDILKICLTSDLTKLFQKNSYIQLYILRRFYLHKSWVHPNHLIFFNIIFKRLEKIFDELPDSSKSLFQLVSQKLYLNANFIESDFMDSKSLNGWQVTAKGGDGWAFENHYAIKHRKYTLVSSYEWCRMHADVPLRNIKKVLGEAWNLFQEDKIVIQAGVCMARRYDCPAEGGCDLAVLDEKNSEIIKYSTKRGDAQSEDFPMAPEYLKVRYVLKYSTLSEKEVDFEKSVLRLFIYGKDRKWWKDYYGPRFYYPFINLDFVEDVV